MHAITRTGLILAALAGGLSGGLATAAETLTGSYTIQGAKGPVTLVLQQEADGKLSGSLSGGDLALVLRGMPQSSGLVAGTAMNAQRQFAAFFQVGRAGDQVFFDLIPANAQSQPDLAAKRRITFPMAAASGAGSVAGGGAGPSGAPPAAHSGFAGTFKNNELTLECLPAAAGYGGIIKMGEQSFPFSARAQGEMLTGTFESAEGKFVFTAVLRGTALMLETGGAVYELAKQGAPATEKSAPVNPLARAGRPAAAAATGVGGGGAGPAHPQGGPAQGANWRVFQHPTGLSMRYPPNWTLTQLPNALQLVPPNVASNGGGVLEAYFVLAEGAEGITSPEDPRAIQYFEQEMAKMAPSLRSRGRPESMRAGAAPGALLTWEGSNPAGMVVRAHMYVTILKGYAVAILAIGDRAKIAERDGSVRGMFSSFAAGVGAKDPQLVGSWKYWSYSSSAGGGFSTEVNRRFVLQPDGTCLWSSSSESAGSARGTNSLGETTWTGGMVGRNNSGVSRGQWSAGNGRLFVIWDDGSDSAWEYQVGGAPGSRRLILKGSGEKHDEWTEER